MRHGPGGSRSQRVTPGHRRGIAGDRASSPHIDPDARTTDRTCRHHTGAGHLDHKSGKSSGTHTTSTPAEAAVRGSVSSTGTPDTIASTARSDGAHLSNAAAANFDSTREYVIPRS